jgi:hypothetical protein
VFSPKFTRYCNFSIKKIYTKTVTRFPFYTSFQIAGFYRLLTERSGYVHSWLLSAGSSYDSFVSSTPMYFLFVIVRLEILTLAGQKNNIL